MEEELPPRIIVLGQTPQGAAIVWIDDTQRVEILPVSWQLMTTQIVRLIGKDATYNLPSLYGTKELRAAINRMLEVIADRCRHRIIDNTTEAGCGIWDISGQIHLVTGSSAYQLQPMKGRLRYIKHEIPLVGGKLLTTNATPWITKQDIRAAERRIFRDIPAVWDRVLSALEPWTFADENDRILVAGMILLTPLQALLPFRPHVWIAGPSNSGKSALLTLLRRLWPRVVTFDGATTEAAVRQKLGGETLPALLDEQENHRHREALLKLLRSSTRGGTSIRGTASQTAKEFRIQHCAWIASISPGLTEEADANRFLDVELAPSEITILPTPEAALLGHDGLAAALIRLPAFLAAYDRLSGATRAQGRAAEAVAVPVAAAVAFGRLTEPQAETLIREIVATRQARGYQQTDDERLMQILGSLPLRQGPLSAYVVAVVTSKSAALVAEELTVLENGGFRLIKDRLFIAHRQVDLRATSLTNQDLSRLLSRVSGAVPDTQRVNGKSQRGYSLPLSCLFDEPPIAPKPEVPLPQDPPTQTRAFLSLPTEQRATTEPQKQLGLTEKESAVKTENDRKIQEYIAAKKLDEASSNAARTPEQVAETDRFLAEILTGLETPS